MMKRRRTILMIIVALLSVVTAEAQNVTFVSTGFEEGVKMHLGLGENDAVPQSRTDTITVIDLSGLEISDVSDAQWLPNVKRMNLRWNQITDIAPLVSLDSLRYLDLRNNHLEDIDLLIFSASDQMTVNVAGNHIKDFSLLFDPFICHFDILGMGVQTEKDAPYVHISHFYGDVSDEGKAMLTLRGYTNIADKCVIKSQGINGKAPLDGYLKNILFDDDLVQTVEAVVTNGEGGDTTWVVPPTLFDIRANQQVSFDTQLPEGYEIRYANANVGTVTVEGTTLNYQAPATESNDTVYFSYYEGDRLKGFSQLVMSNAEATSVGSVATHGVRLSLHGRQLAVDYTGAKPGEQVSVSVFDAAGRKIAGQQSAATATDYHAELSLPYLPDNMIIVEVKTAERRTIRKMKV